jgi:hypothetical protein
VKILEYATLYLHPVEIELQCTDPLFVNSLLADLADQIGYYGISAYKLAAGAARDKRASLIETPARDAYHWRLYGIDESLRDAWWLIVQRFIEGGWELLDPSCVSREYPERVLFFSRKANAGGTEAHARDWRRKTNVSPIRSRAKVDPSGS